MYKVVKKYQKKLMAVFAVLLMIAFVSTFGNRAPGSGGRGSRVVAHIGKTDVTDAEISQAKDDWQVVRQLPAGFSGRSVPEAVLRAAPALVKEIDDHPELFLLLQREALQQGFRANPDIAKDFLKNSLNWNVDNGNPRVDSAARGLEGVLLIQQNISRLENLVKVSEPAWKNDAAKTYQQVRLNLVEFSADSFAREVPPPTPKQLQEQFDKYKNVTPADGFADSRNPFGFGYEYPPRVKLQYFEIPHRQVVEAAIGSGKQRYELEVRAAQLYEENPEKYRNIEPATKPTTSPATQPTTQSATSEPATQPTTLAATEPATRPAIKPFAEVKQQILEQLVEADVKTQTDAITKAIATHLAADLPELRRTLPPETQPTTAPASQPVAATQPANPLVTLQHLADIAKDIQQQFHVLPGVHEIANGWSDRKALLHLPGIGNSSSESSGPFSFYAMSFDQAGGPKVWEPSQPLNDTDQNAYLFRLTAAEPAHAPAMNQVAADVERDYRIAASYQLTRDAAQKALATAQAAGITQAARNAGSLPILSAIVGPFIGRNADPFSSQPPAPLLGYTLTNRSDSSAFTDTAKKLLAETTPAEKHPAAMVELYGAHRVVVAEVDGTALAPGLPAEFVSLQVTQQQINRWLPRLADDWFRYDNVIQRMQYKSDAPEKPQS